MNMQIGSILFPALTVARSGGKCAASTMDVPIPVDGNHRRFGNGSTRTAPSCRPSCLRYSYRWPIVCTPRISRP